LNQITSMIFCVCVCVCVYTHTASGNSIPTQFEPEIHLNSIICICWFKAINKLTLASNVPKVFFFCWGGVLSSLTS